MAITLLADEVEIPEQTELAAGHARDEFQSRVDRDVEALKMATAQAGWPEPRPDRHYHRYVVGADDKAALKAVIRRATTLHKVEAQFYREVRTSAGHIVVKFHVRRKTGKDGQPVADAALTADGSPSPATRVAPR